MNKPLIISLLTLKILAGLYLVHSYGERYENRQESDIYKYHHDGKVLRSLYTENPKAFLSVFFTGNPPSDLPETSVYYHMQNWATMDEEYREYIDYQTNYTFFHPQRVLIRMCAVISFVSTNIYFQSALFSLLGGLGLLLLCLTFFSQATKQTNTIALITLVLFPTSLLWTSTILKETVIVFSLGMSLYGSYKWYIQDKKWNVWMGLAVLGLMLLLLTSLHHFLTLVATGILTVSLTYLFTLPKRIRLIIEVVAPVVAGILFLTLAPKLVTKYNYEDKIGRGGAYIHSETLSQTFYIEYEQFLELLATTNQAPILNTEINFPPTFEAHPFIDGKISKEQTLLPESEYKLNLVYTPANTHIPSQLTTSPSSIITHLPVAFRNVFLAPLFTPSITIQGTWIIFALENAILLLLLLLLLLYATYHYTQNRPTIPKKTKNLLLALLTYATLQFLLIGYTTPILGNIIRYKTVMVLSLVIASLIIINRKDFSQGLFNG